MPTHSISAVLFDFGGVIAEEGFEAGLKVIAANNGLEADTFFRTATEIIYACGYVTGKTDEHHYWQLMREGTGITGTDQELTEAILSRFVLRPRMLAVTRQLQKQNILPVILSDQTDWLDRLNRRNSFLPLFARVFNSYYLGKTKRDPSIFPETLAALDISPANALFVDDNAGHIQRASEQGLHTHLFQNQDTFFEDLALRFLP